MSSQKELRYEPPPRDLTRDLRYSGNRIYLPQTGRGRIITHRGRQDLRRF